MSRDKFLRSELAAADLVLDALYEGGRGGNSGDDVLSPLLGVSNQGGFRHLGQLENPRLVVITTSMNEPDWPDYLDIQTGMFTYYGDNRKAGRELHDTPRWGNRILRDLFSRTHGTPEMRKQVPPVLVFRGTGVHRDVRFLGLAVPGADGLPLNQDLVAVWHHSDAKRFQNYRAIFTILDEPVLKRAWIDGIRNGNTRIEDTPSAWKSWIETGRYKPLHSKSIVVHRTKDEQLPKDTNELQMLVRLHENYKDNPFEFESCAARIAEMLLPEIVSIDVTRASRDGGRDAIGKYRIGSDATSIEVDFALEAKCYGRANSVGVTETSRLISRLRHRQFGILVTTSYVNQQAYKEIREDGHPILIISGADIITILKRAGIADRTALDSWLKIQKS